MDEKKEIQFENSDGHENDSWENQLELESEVKLSTHKLECGKPFLTETLNLAGVFWIVNLSNEKQFIHDSYRGAMKCKDYSH